MSEKNIPAILGSPHSNGMTAAMLDCAILKAEKVGYIVTKINLYEKNLSYCKGCRACMKTQTCIQKDDIQEIVHLIRKCQIVILAAPVFDRLLGAAMEETNTFVRPVRLHIREATRMPFVCCRA